MRGFEMQSWTRWLWRDGLDFQNTGRNVGTDLTSRQQSSCGGQRSRIGRNSGFFLTTQSTVGKNKKVLCYFNGINSFLINRKQSLLYVVSKAKHKYSAKPVEGAANKGATKHKLIRRCHRGRAPFPEQNHETQIREGVVGRWGSFGRKKELK